VNFIAEIIAKVFEFWHQTISLALPSSCRHEPSCSVYGAEALRTHGVFRGLGMTAWRVLRCNPWGSFGYDPVSKGHHE
jgi:putative membrane protein insertion efficiency factor